MTDFTISRRAAVLGAAAAAVLSVPVNARRRVAGTTSWARGKKSRLIRGIPMAYYESGRGRPIVFLHGNPTSSYLWRRVIPHVQPLGRCIAPDLVGMGDSGKLPDSGPQAYTYITHREYLFALLEELEVQRDAILVIHDWGSALGLDWAQRHPDRVGGVAYMEAIFRPPAGEDVGAADGGFFGPLRSPKGEELILQQNMFVEQILIGGLNYYLTEEDKAEYRRPYLEPGESRRPTLTWPRELPINGTPAENDRLVRSYTNWFAASDLPKLFIRAVPGAIFRSPEMLALARSFRNQRDVTVYGGHFVQEVSGDAIGRATAEWIRELA